MAVDDRWHKDPEEGDVPCKCGKGRNKLYPGADHLKGARWQVRWRDPEGKQRSKNFDLRDGDNRNIHADAFDKEIQGRLVAKNYVDPRAGEVTLQEFAEKLRKARKIPNPETAADLEARLRNHVYEGEPGSGRTPMDAPSIGQHSMGLLAAQASLVAAWAEGIPLEAQRARKVMGDVSFVFRAGMDDGIVLRDPVHATSVTWPKIGPTKARPWSIGQVEAMRAELPERFRVLLDIGAGAGLRQGEMLGLGADDIDWLVRDDPRVRVVRQVKYVEGGLYFAPLKNRKPHSAPLSPELKTRLSRHLDKFPAAPVTLPWWDPHDAGRGGRHLKPHTVRLIVTSEEGKAVLGPSLSNIWRKARRRAGITPDDGREREDGCHALRHTFVSVQLRAGADIVRVAHWIGDSLATVVDTYAHFLPGGDDGDARAAVDAFLAGPGDGSSALDVPGAGESTRL